MPSELILIMGVSGSGKSTIAKTLAEQLGFVYLDADDFHSQRAKEMMAQGQAINDLIRDKWIKNILLYLADDDHQEKPFVLAYSGLKKKQRQRFHLLDKPLTKILLHGEQQLIAERLNQRRDHFFSAELLASQFDAMEPPENDENIHVIAINQPTEALVEQAKKIYLNENIYVQEA